MRIAVALALAALPVASQDANHDRASFVFARDGFCGGAPGSPHASVEGDVLALENGVLRCTWSVEGGALRPLRIEDRITGTVHELDGGEAFRLILDEGEEISASSMDLMGAPQLREPRLHEKSGCFALRMPGDGIRLLLRDAAAGLQLEWRAHLRHGSSYVQQELRIEAGEEGLPLRDVVLIDLPLTGARLAGSVDGSPAFAGPIFLAIEHPMSRSSVDGDRVRCSLRRSGALGAGEELMVRSVIGLTAPGQERRGFLYYLERERAHPYRQFLHYNSWYDIAWPGHRMNEDLCREAIALFARELIADRGVPMASFVFDDGWDDFDSLWGFHEGFPDGFAPLAELAREHGAGIGTWISPWGGYGEAQQARLRYGRSQGFETHAGGFSLAGERYGRRFEGVCREFLLLHGCNYFKFDGIGGGAYATGAPVEATADLEALLALSRELREWKADLFVNATVGTWPSPFWLWSVDSIWRQGEDISFHGEAGTLRDRWITYRDGMAYQRIVGGGPMFPLNSVMFHGLAFAQLGTPTRMNQDLAAFEREARSFFATGTGLQELYVTGKLLSGEHWDALAEAALWAKANEDVLVDSHWVGGDPKRGEVYGFAAWIPNRATLMLRNPLEEEQSFELDPGPIFELPEGAQETWRLRRPWRADADRPAIEIAPGKPTSVLLEPLEVAVFGALPAKEED